MIEEHEIPAAPILAELDQASFAAGWADGWRGDNKETFYDQNRSPREANAYDMGRKFGDYRASQAARFAFRER